MNLSQGGGEGDKGKRPSLSTSQEQSTDTDELKRFREKWKRELTQPHPPPSPSPSTASPSPSPFPTTEPPSTRAVHEEIPLSPFPPDNYGVEPRISYPHPSVVIENPLITRFLDLLEEEPLDIDPANILVLPNELQLVIFAFLDVKSLEACSTACRTWYIIARDEGLPQFQRLCLKTWAVTTTAIFEAYQCDWRNMFLRRPRLRDDGIYISRNHYLRAGSTEGSYYQPVHEVVYYRYLRFFSSGTVIYALSSDPPKQVLNWFKPTPALSVAAAQSRAVHAGSYILEEDNVQIWVKISATHTTCLEMKLASTRLGLNDRLALQEYKCVNDNGTVDKIDVEIKRFHFVKLPKQYLVDTLQPPSEVE